jgi:hypothetical protein
MPPNLAAAHAIIARFCVSLVTRPDRDEVRTQLAAAFVEHVGDLWPAGRDAASPEWIAANVDEVLATVERLYASFWAAWRGCRRCSSGSIGRRHSTGKQTRQSLGRLGPWPIPGMSCHSIRREMPTQRPYTVPSVMRCPVGN